jgi:hypothetical protein
MRSRCAVRYFSPFRRRGAGGFVVFIIIAEDGERIKSARAIG